MTSSHPSPTAPSQRSHRNRSHRDPAIRHSGRAHIRGKIRRIWRPRYLELCDSGVIRYYELPPLADITMPEEEDWQHVNMVIKDTLIIHHARIIDVTTLRDLHVGLPRGSFGFLFRGQRIGYNSHNISNNDFLFAGGDSGQNAFVDLQHAQSCSTNPVGGEVNPPREYFCAVSTLEEAQSWVIALQWSVKVCQQTLLRLNSPTDNENDNETLGSNIEVRNSSDWSSTNERIENTHSTTPKVVNHTRSKTGRILVTKVRGFRTIRADILNPTTYFFRWEVAYEVALLLVENNKDKIEERRILVTVQQLEKMLEEMSIAMESRASFLDGLRKQIEDLPRFQITIAGGRNNNDCKAQAFEASISKLNLILRALAMEAAVVNSRSMRHLFGLDMDRPVIEEIQWWKSYRSSSENAPGKSKRKLTNRAIAPAIFRQVRSIPSNMIVDDYVRQWLARQPIQLESLNIVSRLYLESQLWILQRPWFLAAILGLVFAFIYSTSQIYQRNMIYVTLRCDALVLTSALAYWIGQRKGQMAQQRKSRYRRSSTGNSTPVSTSGKAVVPQRRNQEESRSNQNLIASTNIPTSSIGTTDENIITSESSDESVFDDGDELDYFDEETEIDKKSNVGKLSSPIPQYPENDGCSCWSEPFNPAIFHVRGSTYLEDRIKVPSGRSPFKCRGVDLWLTDNPQRHIARHPSVLGSKLLEEDTFLVNFLLPFGNFVSYFSVPPLSDFPNKEVANVWSSFVAGDQQYRDARLKLLPVVIDGPWIVKAAVGNGKSPALLGKVIPLQYFFRQPKGTKKGIYEVDVIITASSIAKGILNVVKGHAQSLSIAFALIIEASQAEELPETVLCSFQIHALDLDDCPHLPEKNLFDIKQ